MKALKIAASDSAFDCFQTSREVIPLNQTDYTDVAVAVLSVEDVMGPSLYQPVLPTVRLTGCERAHPFRP
ncbi:hypothetical protein [Pseudomonas sp.]|uniref:hypothetical protein n=1 Tax=Pseudomonas sp. TaxID=306 RepID=UPI00286BEFD9|nr:hypothetical protein [Pseudomonas sp.]